MLRVVAGVAVLTLGAGIVMAQNTAVIKERKELMKGFAGATKAPTAMAKGEAPFELAKVQASLKVFQANAAKLKTMWPDDAKTGEETRALPVIWTKKADFLEWFDGLAKDAKAAEAAIKDEASFKAEWKNVVDYCGGCHKEYRAPQK
jgi:cytochrome c556